MKTEKRNNQDLIAKLQYQLQRYKAMGNGAACQILTTRIHKLRAQESELI